VRKPTVDRVASPNNAVAPATQLERRFRCLATLLGARFWNDHGVEYFIVVCGCLGAWLLVAGPVYQAALELEERALNPDDFSAAFDAAPAPRKVGVWWWLVPPVAYLIHRSRRLDFRRQVMAALPLEKRTQIASFTGKALGWIVVAIGAFFIAIKETWELTLLFDMSWVLFIVIVVAMSAASALFTVVRIRSGHRMIHT
jgi:hypothetical protein